MQLHWIKLKRCFLLQQVKPIAPCFWQFCLWSEYNIDTWKLLFFKKEFMHNRTKSYPQILNDIWCPSFWIRRHIARVLYSCSKLKINHWNKKEDSVWLSFCQVWFFRILWPYLYDIILWSPTWSYLSRTVSTSLRNDRRGSLVPGCPQYVFVK